MKAGLRKAKREKLKLSQSNALNSVNESQSQAPGTEQNYEIIQKNLSSTNSDIIEINKNINTNLEKEDIKSLKSNLNPESIKINNNSDIPKDGKLMKNWRLNIIQKKKLKFSVKNIINIIMIK